MLSAFKTSDRNSIEWCSILPPCWFKAVLIRFPWLCILRYSFLSIFRQQRRQQRKPADTVTTILVSPLDLTLFCHSQPCSGFCRSGKNTRAQHLTVIFIKMTSRQKASFRFLTIPLCSLFSGSFAQSSSKYRQITHRNTLDFHWRSLKSNFITKLSCAKENWKCRIAEQRVSAPSWRMTNPRGR